MFGNSSQTTVSDPTVTGVTYNGSVMTHIAAADCGFYDYNEPIYLRTTIFYMTNPPTSSAHTVAVTLSGLPDSCVGGVCSYSGASSSIPDNTKTASDISSNPMSLVITPVAANCWVFDVIAISFNISGCDNTLRWYGSAYFGGSDTGGSVSGPTTISWEQSNNFGWVISAVSFAPTTVTSTKRVHRQYRLDKGLASAVGFRKYSMN